MFLSLLYIEMFLGEYLTSRDFRPFSPPPPISFLCLRHHPFSPSALRPGIHVGSTKQPGQYYGYNPTVLNGFEPSTCPKRHPEACHLSVAYSEKLEAPICPRTVLLQEGYLQTVCRALLSLCAHRMGSGGGIQSRLTLCWELEIGPRGLTSVPNKGSSRRPSVRCSRSEVSAV